MNNESPKINKEVRNTTFFLIAFTSLIGGFLLAVSVGISHENAFWKEFTKELGIVLLSVCGVSMIYELFVAEKHFQKFFETLRTQIERGETNAATCEKLGIREIFSSRDIYENKYPLTLLAAATSPGSTFRIVARSLFLLLNKPHAIKQAISQGAQVELCFFDPETIPLALEKIAQLDGHEIASAISTFRKQIAEWLVLAHPSGSIEIKYHQVHLFDSYFEFVLEGDPLAVWDLSFGRDITAKRIFLLDTRKGLGANLKQRYNLIWEQATLKFHYQNGKINLDELPH